MNVANDMKIYSNKKLSDIINVNVRAIAVFDKYNFDYCFNGNRSIREVCKEKNLDLRILIAELKEISDEFQVDKFSEWRLDFLVDYILNNHHQYIHKMIPVISDLSQKISDEYGEKFSELKSIARIFAVVYKDLKQHMLKEEQILFPYIKQLVSLNIAGNKSEKPYFGMIDNPISMMESDHKNALDEYDNLKKLTNNFTTPEESNEPLKNFLKELRDFGKDLHIHIHLENNILFPKSIALERQML
jgi:regulator of cell morphogenesis and NO signaling